MESGNIISIDGKEYEFRGAETILDVARRNGIDIPTLCHMKGVSPTGACRMCMVEVSGARALVASCAMAAAPKMAVKTQTERVMKARRLNLELLLASGHHNCLDQDLDMDASTDSQSKALSTASSQ